ncbi:condensation domain-containing protein [Streptomyces massasporeus]|uniref:condensation domain-containing protein n=1 Tax=Streptomyces massasporeus TaxID=67324 RepID=UPI003701E269
MSAEHGPRPTGAETVPISRGHFHAYYHAADMPVAERHRLVVTLFAPLPEGLSVEDVRVGINLLVKRHAMLRTTVGRLDSGRPVHHVHPPAPLPAEIRELRELGADGLITMSVRFTDELLRIERTWPIKVGLITVQGRPSYILVALHHCIVDLDALGELQDEFGQILLNLLTGAGEEAFLRPALHPSDRVALERGPRGEQGGHAAVAHWTRLLDQADNVSFPYHRTTQSPRRARALQLTSQALDVAVRHVSATSSLPPTALVLAAFHAMVSSYTGGTVVWSMLMGKGTVAHGSTLIECTPQSIFVRLAPPGDRALVDVAGHVLDETLIATQHRDYDFDRFLEERAARSVARRSLIEWEASFSSRLSLLDTSATRPSAQEVAGLPQLLTRSRVHWSEQHTALPVASVSVGSNGKATTINFVCDHELLSKDDMLRVMRGAEALLVEAACPVDQGGADTVQRAKVTFGWPRRPDWVRTGGRTWVDMQATRELLTTHDAVCGAELSVTADEVPLLVAAVRARAGAPSPSPEALGQFMLRGLDRPGQAVPDRFTITTCDLSACADCAASAVPSSHQAAADDAAAQDALLTVVAEVLGRAPDGTRSYLEQGGTAASYPGLKADLERAGWTGLTGRAMLGPLSLDRIASALRRTSVGAAP